MAKIKGTFYGKFVYDDKTDQMYTVCGVDAEEESNIPVEILMRAYVAMGGYLNMANQKIRYNIDRPEQNLEVVSQIKESEE